MNCYNKRTQNQVAGGVNPEPGKQTPLSSSQASSRSCMALGRSAQNMRSVPSPLFIKPRAHEQPFFLSVGIVCVSSCALCLSASEARRSPEPLDTFDDGTPLSLPSLRPFVSLRRVYFADSSVWCRTVGETVQRRGEEEARRVAVTVIESALCPLHSLRIHLFLLLFRVYYPQQTIVPSLGSSESPLLRGATKGMVCETRPARPPLVFKG